MCGTGAGTFGSDGRSPLLRLALFPVGTTLVMKGSGVRVPASAWVQGALLLRARTRHRDEHSRVWVGQSWLRNMLGGLQPWRFRHPVAMFDKDVGALACTVMIGLGIAAGLGVGWAKVVGAVLLLVWLFAVALPWLLSKRPLLWRARRQ